MRIALGLEYDGRGLRGWQTQPGGATVQDALETALSAFLGESVATICAGRTDAGVHATAQVVHLDTARLRSEESWVRGVNAHLPAAVAVRWARVVPEDFHARYGARARRYDYWILNDRVRAPLLDGRATWIARPLDVDAMAAAAGTLVGTHDFSAFRSAECQAATPVRTLSELSVERFGRLVRVRATANAFLHHMVRNLVGSLVYVGLGRQPSGWPRAILDGRDRKRAAPTLAAEGLYLSGVDYDPALGLPSTADVCLLSP